MRVLYTFGLNEDGQCGVPIRSEHNGRYFPIPVAFPLRVSISSVSAGSRHTLALTTTGDVYSWGWGHLGQLGHGDARNLNVPTKITTILNATFISAGGVHSACIDRDNYCYTWGSCTYGQLGLGKEVTETRKCIVTTPSIVTLRPDAGVKGSAYYKNSQIDSSNNVSSLASLEHNVKNALKVSKVSCGGLHTAAIDLLGNVYCWGKADSGQTGYADWYRAFSYAVCSPRKVPGLGPRTRAMSFISPQSSPRRNSRLDREESGSYTLGVRAVEVSCGGFHTLVRMEDGSVFAMGKQDFGILGTGTENSISIDIGAEAPVMVQYSPLSKTLPGVYESSRPVSATQISTGGWHTAVIDSEGELYMCGKGEYGRLGLGDEKARMGLTALPQAGVVSRKVGVSVKDSPKNTTTTTTTTNANTNTNTTGTVVATLFGEVVATPEQRSDKVVQVAAGGSHSVWRTESNRLFTVGRVDGGRLGVGYVTQDSLAELTILNNTGKKSLDRLLHPIDITAQLHADLARRFESRCGIADSPKHNAEGDVDSSSGVDNSSGDGSSGSSSDSGFGSGKSDGSSDTSSIKILQVAAGGSHSAVLVEYPCITDIGAFEEFLQAVDARIQAEECKMDPKRIQRVK